MEIGKLRHRITIQKNEEYEDENGFIKSDWVTKATVWASVNNLHGKEYWEAKKYKAENTVEFIIRYSACKDISVKDRIVFKDTVYNISSVDNILYKNETIKIKAVAVI